MFEDGSSYVVPISTLVFDAALDQANRASPPEPFSAKRWRVEGRTTVVLNSDKHGRGLHSALVVES